MAMATSSHNSSTAPSISLATSAPHRAHLIDALVGHFLCNALVDVDVATHGATYGDIAIAAEALQRATQTVLELLLFEARPLLSPSLLTAFLEGGLVVRPALLLTAGTEPRLVRPEVPDAHWQACSLGSWLLSEGPDPVSSESRTSIPPGLFFSEL